MKDMWVAGVDTLERANRFLEITFWPWWEKRLASNPSRGATPIGVWNVRIGLEEILSVRVARTVACGHTVSAR